MQASRRAFLRGAFLTREGREQASAAVRPLGPYPPCHLGAIDPGICAACEAPCAVACEDDIIDRHPAEHALAGLPYLRFDTAGCSYCGACSEACPAPAAASSVGRHRLGTARLEQIDCMAYSGVTCMSCSAACEYAAIVLDRLHRPGVDATACNGCGACIGVCPPRALRVEPRWAASDTPDG